LPVICFEKGVNPIKEVKSILVLVSISPTFFVQKPNDQLFCTLQGNHRSGKAARKMLVKLTTTFFDDSNEPQSKILIEAT
jgi:hypothetical protein